MLNFVTLLTGASLSAGVNLYLTLVAVGAYARLGHASPELQNMIEPFGSWFVLVPAAIMFLGEFIADKVPAFDNIWDVAHTVIRPVGAVFIAFTLAEDYGIAAQIFSATTGGSLAFGSHAIKAGTRAVARLNPEPTTNAASSTMLSIVEDVGALGLVMLSMVSPWVAAGVLSVVLALMIWFGPRMVSLFFFATHATWSRLTAPFRKQNREGPLQAVAPTLLSHVYDAKGRFEALATSPCYVRLPGLLNYRRGALVMSDSGVMVAYRRFFIRQLVDMDVSSLDRVVHKRRWFREVVTLERGDERIHLFFVRGRGRYVQDLCDLLASKGVHVSSEGTPVSMPDAVPQPA